ncbi:MULTISPECIES: PrgI family protein [Bacillus cereus group]|uniref:PrgI family protein n=1 Tax=Bacillus cereus group TaxID=86661 RepID=UPI0010BE6E6C|nr:MULTISPECIES: PrgI family protein [Bacillus cereus group]MBE7123423.1 PrgI family protein [Bacillus cereus]TKI39100.1 PrgI family protein [Bacillus mycoides]
MRKVKVPVDMSSEQKTFLGVISKRQLIYIAIGAVLLHTYIPMIWKMIADNNLIIAGIVCVVAALPVLIVVLPLAFIYKEKQHMFLDQYLYIKYKRRSERGRWIRG